MFDDSRVIAREIRPDKKKKTIVFAGLCSCAALFSGLTVWQALSGGLWIAGALAAALVFAVAGVVFGAQCLADRRREREPVLRLSGSNLFLRRNAWVCLPLAMIGEIRLKRRGRRECVVVLVENDAYESRYIEDARAVLGEIERAAEKARQG